ncbi:MAG: sigma-54-dependent Fis family transcriptional regulator [Verrucomicrobiae bacterium]|nr:sigma-54-dependent Fis family transcriptional regulator [Verrucomicrobiae bacterium]
MKRLLLSFVGFHDPYYQSGIDHLDAPGPVVSLLQARTFDGLVLFQTPGAHPQFLATCKAVKKHFPNVELFSRSLDELHDPTDHIIILRYLRRYIKELLEQQPDAEWVVSISSGTPSMHACWLLLVAEGTLLASIIYGHPPRTGMDTYQISEVDLDAPEFPDITPRGKGRATGKDSVLPSALDAAHALGIIGENEDFAHVVNKAGKLARYDGHLLLLGDTGVGKERFADLIHRLSPRHDKAFLPVNCGALPSELAESILFGHKKGAFTGAISDQKGAFDDADGGTLFLDEIGDMPVQVQAKLLRTLQSGEILPLGLVKSHAVDVRVVAATNLDILQAIKSGAFRADLYQRFSASLHIPSLSKRRDDVPRLALHALNRWCRRHNETKRFSRKAMARLVAYDWPGNVRELFRVIEYAAITSQDALISPDDIQFDVLFRDVSTHQPVEPHESFRIREYLDNEYRRLLKRALELTHNNQRQAAKLLGISPQAINNAINQKLSPPDA